MKPDYKAIADEYAAKSYISPSAAFAAMSAETVTVAKAEARYTEIGLMSDLGMSVADALLNKIVGSPLVSPRVQRLIESEVGINLADAETQGLLTALEGNGDISTAEKNLLLDLASETKPKWPNLKEGHVQNAVEWRQGGLI